MTQYNLSNERVKVTLIERYQDEIYSLALSLTNNEKKSKILAAKVFDKSLGKVYGSYNKIKLQLFRELLLNIASVSMKKMSEKNILYLFKRRLNLFDRKVFVLKFEFNLTSTEIAVVLRTSVKKVKKSLFYSIDKMIKIMEDKKSEMR
ncbi:MAG: hypothetical protein LBQ37_03790 [Elusimicrobiota bacterium]|nr:hypothetical protein [Elusimicrobiota bacterium]